jgi:hypothetical protein
VSVAESDESCKDIFASSQKMAGGADNKASAGKSSLGTKTSAAVVLPLDSDPAGMGEEAKAAAAAESVGSAAVAGRRRSEEDLRSGGDIRQKETSPDLDDAGPAPVGFIIDTGLYEVNLNDDEFDPFSSVLQKPKKSSSQAKTRSLGNSFVHSLRPRKLATRKELPTDAENDLTASLLHAWNRVSARASPCTYKGFSRNPPFVLALSDRHTLRPQKLADAGDTATPSQLANKSAERTSTESDLERVGWVVGVNTNQRLGARQRNKQQPTTANKTQRSYKEMYVPMHPEDGPICWKPSYKGLGYVPVHPDDGPTFSQVDSIIHLSSQADSYICLTTSTRDAAHQSVNNTPPLQPQQIGSCGSMPMEGKQSAKDVRSKELLQIGSGGSMPVEGQLSAKSLHSKESMTFGLGSEGSENVSRQASRSTHMDGISGDAQSISTYGRSADMAGRSSTSVLPSPRPFRSTRPGTATVQATAKRVSSLTRQLQGHARSTLASWVVVQPGKVIRHLAQLWRQPQHPPKSAYRDQMTTVVA